MRWVPKMSGCVNVAHIIWTYKGSWTGSGVDSVGGQGGPDPPLMGKKHELSLSICHCKKNCIILNDMILCIIVLIIDAKQYRHRLHHPPPQENSQPVGNTVSCSVYPESHKHFFLYSALTVALSTESKVVVSDMGRVFHIWRVILNENSRMIMLSRALRERVGCTDLSLYRQAERINSLQRFWNRWNKPFFQTIHSFTGQIVSHLQTLTLTAKSIFFLQGLAVCVSVAACKFVCILYNSICMYTLLVDSVWMSNPAKLEPESLSCWMCFLSLPGLSSLGVKKELLCKGNWVLADRSVKYNQRCQSRN